MRQPINVNQKKNIKDITCNYNMQLKMQAILLCLLTDAVCDYEREKSL